MLQDEMTKSARDAQREYLKQWRKKNPQKVRAYNAAYWERKAKQKEKAEEAKDT